MKAYSEDLRKKILQAVDRGMPKSEAAGTFGVSRSSVKRYAAARREGKPLTPKKHPGSKPKLDQRARKLLEADVEDRPAITLKDRCRFLEELVGVFGERVHPFEVVEEDGFLPKGRSVGASERDEFLRAAWRALVGGSLDARRFVFVDEMGTNTSLCVLYGWARRGHRAYFRVPRNWGANVTPCSLA